jgi:hypothetical protein
MSTLIQGIIFFAIIACIGIWIKRKSDSESKKAYDYAKIFHEDPQKAYEDALRSGDKALALQKGREYYAFKRGGEILTIYDEQAIQNDLSTMR